MVSSLMWSTTKITTVAGPEGGHATINQKALNVILTNKDKMKHTFILINVYWYDVICLTTTSLVMWCSTNIFPAI